VSKKKRNWIPVVTALIKKGDQILVGQRPETGSLPGVWEFPGGKIEAGESPEDALTRELKEELGIDVEVGDLKLSCTHNYEGVSLLILFFEVNFWKGEPKEKHHTEVKWVHRDQLHELNLPQANRLILDRLLKSLYGNGKR
jgi:8-oxo-dGTP diphosphatase